MVRAIHTVDSSALTMASQMTSVTSVLIHIHQGNILSCCSNNAQKTVLLVFDCSTCLQILRGQGDSFPPTNTSLKKFWLLGCITYCYSFLFFSLMQSTWVCPLLGLLCVNKGCHSENYHNLNLQCLKNLE